jgi:hypothetical protein
MADQQTVVKVTEAARGPRGKSAYQTAVDNGFVGTEAEWLAGFGIAVGTIPPAAPAVNTLWVDTN